MRVFSRAVAAAAVSSLLGLIPAAAIAAPGSSTPHPDQHAALTRAAAIPTAGPARLTQRLERPHVRAARAGASAPTWPSWRRSRNESGSESWSAGCAGSLTAAAGIR